MNIGQANNRLTLIECANKNKFGQKLGLFLCICGKQCIKGISSVKHGYTKSCGCLQKQKAAENAKHFSRIQTKARTAANINRRGKPNFGKRISIKQLCINKIFADYKNSAKRDNRIFELSKLDIETLIFSQCDRCGRLPTREFVAKRIRLDNESIYWNGIDRIDNSKGYTLNNVRPYCWDCNNARGSMNNEDWSNLDNCVIQKFLLKNKS